MRVGVFQQGSRLGRPRGSVSAYPGGYDPDEIIEGSGFTRAELAPYGEFPEAPTGAPPVVLDPSVLWTKPPDPPVDPNAIYVAQTGDDAAGDGSELAPYRTLAQAKNDAVPGSTIYIRGGVDGVYAPPGYGDNSTAAAGPNKFFLEGSSLDWVSKSGAPGNPITIRNYPGESVKVKGDREFGMRIRLSDWITVAGIEFEGEVDSIPMSLARLFQYTFRRGSITAPNEQRVPVLSAQNFSGLEDISGVAVFSPTYFSTIGLLIQRCNHVVVEYCSVHHWPGSGIRAFRSDYYTLNRNIVHNNSRRSAVGNHGVILHTNEATENITSDEFTCFVTGNIVYENFNQVSSWSPGKTIIHWSNSGTGLENEEWDEGTGISFQKTDASWTHHKALFANNWVARNGKGMNTNDAGRAEYYHNVLFENHVSGLGLQNAGIAFQSSGATGLVARNNVVQLNPAATGRALTSDTATELVAVVADNVYLGGISAGFAAGNIAADPLFNDPAGYDFRVKVGSQAVGVPQVSVSDDLLGVSRPGPTVTAGAYELAV